jgi:hypothetical protein
MLMPKKMGDFVNGISALSKAGVDDIWLIASDINTTLMCLKEIRISIKSPKAGVFGLPQDLGNKICIDIAKRCNFWRFWTHTIEEEQLERKVPGITWFANANQTDPINNHVSVRCYGDPIGIIPGVEKDANFNMITDNSALCGHITSDIVRKHKHRFGFYVISPFAGRNPDAWHLHADLDLVRSVCCESMILKEKSAYEMELIR